MGDWKAVKKKDKDEGSDPFFCKKEKTAQKKADILIAFS